MNTLICTVGLPLAGKTTWARQTGFPVVSAEAIRLAAYGRRYLPRPEPLVWWMAHVFVEALFHAGNERVVVDSSNLIRAHRDRWRGREWVTLWKVFPTPPEECKRRALEAGKAHLVDLIDRLAERAEPLDEDEMEYTGGDPQGPPEQRATGEAGPAGRTYA